MNLLDGFRFTAFELTFWRIFLPSSGFKGSMKKACKSVVYPSEMAPRASIKVALFHKLSKSHTTKGHLYLSLYVRPEGVGVREWEVRGWRWRWGPGATKLHLSLIYIFVCPSLKGLGGGVQGVRGSGVGSQRRDGEWLEMEKRECSIDGGVQGRSLLAIKRPTEGGPCSWLSTKIFD